MIALPPPPPATSTIVYEVRPVPFFSQFTNITDPEWKKKSCGIASLAMIVAYYNSTSTPDVILKQALAAHGYIEHVGWTYKSLITVADMYGLTGEAYDFGRESRAFAFASFKKHLLSGPVIASVHYKFDPKSTIPHLVVIDSIHNETVYYNDPAAKSGKKEIALVDFLKGWKKRFIVIRPQT